MKFRILVWLVLVALMAAGLFAAETLLEQKNLASKTIRLHVVANSDSESDQEQKLRVRDAVLQHVSLLTADCGDAQAAQKQIASHLEEIRKTAQNVLYAEQSDYTVEASVGFEEFPTRRYDTFSLPAGSYPTLRINIGQAAGHNWWCVVFPSLCTAATAEELSDCAQTGGYDRTETALITGGEEEYELRFKTLEWLQKLRQWFQ